MAAEIVAFIGPDGAGKTTTLKMLAGVLHPTSGSATVLEVTGVMVAVPTGGGCNLPTRCARSACSI